MLGDRVKLLISELVVSFDKVKESPSVDFEAFVVAFEDALDVVESELRE